VIEIDDSKVDLTNFIGNVIDLGMTISSRPRCPPTPPICLSSLKYPVEHPEFHGTISDEEIWKSTLNHDNYPCIMVIKCGSGSGLTVGRLNIIRSLTRVYFNGHPSQMSKEFAISPRNSESGAFSGHGDSGSESAVVDGKGRFAGLLTGGAGVSEVSDCTYLTSINFLLKRMLEHGLQTDLSSYHV